MKVYIFLLQFIFIFKFCSSQGFAYVDEVLLFDKIPNYNFTKKSLDSLKVTLEVESKELQENNRIRVLELISKYKVEEEPLLDNLYKVLKANDPINYNKLVKEQEQVIQSIRAKEAIYNKAYEKQMAPIMQRINRTVEDYCRAKGITLLYKLRQIESISALLDTKLNVTEEIVKHFYEVK